MRLFGTMILAAMFIGQAAQALDAEGELWVKQVGDATKACAAQFRQKFGETKGSRFADCLTDQTVKATETCIGVAKDAFAGCVSGRALKVMQSCDLSRC
jgi:hypothetical protein